MAHLRSFPKRVRVWDEGGEIYDSGTVQIAAGRVVVTEWRWRDANEDPMPRCSRSLVPCPVVDVEVDGRTKLVEQASMWTTRREHV